MLFWMINAICQQIDARKQDLFELLSSLIRINSENFGDHGNERACREYVLRTVG